ncbi:MAG TPA: DUF3880 domain-containing protein [Bacillota bacterium]|nr:DUF3880 domain-containing protein [Bacillota bacterium]
MTQTDKVEVSTNITALVDLKEAFFSFDNWHGKAKYLKGNRKEMIFQSVDETAKYYSFYEENTSFQRLTKGSDKIRLSRNNTFHITGTIVGNVEVVIYLIEYGANMERIKTHHLPLNEQISILKRSQTVYGRLAIRMEGIGDLHISDLHVSPFIPATFGNDSTGHRNLVREKKVACILDFRSKEGLLNQAQLIHVTPQDWESKLLKSKPDFLLVESAWKGHNGTWKGKIATDESSRDHHLLKELVLWCNTNHVPTVFWNTEDPYHFDAFKRAAALFDYIFTSDVNTIPAYKAMTGHQRVFHLPPAAVSTMYDKAVLLKQAQESPRVDDDNEKNEVVSIIEPTQGEMGGRSQADRYAQLFDALAHGKPVVGDYFPWAQKAFHDIAIFTNDENKRNECFTELQKDHTLYAKRSRQGVREICRKHLYRHRIHSIVQSINIPYRPVAVGITFLFSVDSKQAFERAMEMTASQSYWNYNNVIILKNVAGYETLFNRYNNETTAIILDERIYSRKIADVIHTSFMAVMDVNQSYAPYFAEDAIYAGTAASAMAVMSDDYMTSSSHAIFNRNYLNSFLVDDVLNNSAGLMGKLQEQKRGVWQKAGQHRLLIPTDSPL